MGPGVRVGVGVRVAVGVRVTVGVYVTVGVRVGVGVGGSRIIVAPTNGPLFPSLSTMATLQ